MQIRLTGEQPFQVLSTTFTIGPSADGYDLMFSADGVNYSKLFTVGANTNRQVTQVAAGSYYYLSGNTGNVVVNWFGNCVVDNGGGGSYVLPVASQDTLGGVKIGSGLTINSGGTLSLSSDAEVSILKGKVAYPAVHPILNDIGMVVSKKAQYGDYVRFRTDRVDYEWTDPVFSLESGNFNAYVYTENSSYFRIDCDDNENYDTFYLGDDPEITQNSALTGNYLFTAEFSGNYFELSVEDSSTHNAIRIKKDWIVQSQPASVGVGGNTSAEFEGVKVYDGTDWQPVGGEQNYVIADALSAVTNTVEGMMAYVPSYVKETNTYTKIYISDFEHFTENTEGRAENYLARIHWGDWDSSTMGVEDLLAVSVYQSGNEFYWDFSNDEKYHTREIERDGYYYKIEYRCYKGVVGDGSDAYFEFRALDETPYGNYIIALSDYVSTAETSNVIVEPAKTYTYNGEDWVRASDFVYDWESVEPATSADTAELLSDIRKNLENGIYPSILREGRMLMFEGNESQWASFYVAGPGNSEHRLYLSDSVFDDNEFDSRGVRFDNASLVDASTQVFNWLEADYSTGHLSGDYSCVSYGPDTIWKVWFKRGNGDDSVVAPLKWRNHYTTEVEGEQKNVWVFGADIPFETASGIEVWSGVWSVLQDDWYEDNAHTLSWTKVSGPLVDSNYPIYTPSE